MHENTVIELVNQRSCTSPPAVCYQEGKGHISVNLHYGCTQGCAFCISLADPFPEARQVRSLHRLASVPQVLDCLRRNAGVVSQLKLSVMDFHDPFDPRHRHLLCELLSGLARHMPGQPVLLTTRLHPGEELVRWLASLRELRISVFVSAGDACGGVSPVTPVWPRLKLLGDCADAGLHTVLLLKPLVQEWTRVEALRHLLAHAAATCSEVVMAGLAMPPPVEASLRRAGWPVPAQPSDPHGGVAPGARAMVLRAAGELCPALPLSEHRSCAVNRRGLLPCKVAHADGGSLRIKACRCWADRWQGPPRGQDHAPRDAAGYCLAGTWRKAA